MSRYEQGKKEFEPKLWDRGLPVPGESKIPATAKKSAPEPSTNRDAVETPETNKQLPTPKDLPLAAAPKINPWKSPAPNAPASVPLITSQAIPTVPPRAATSAAPPGSSAQVTPPKKSPWGQVTSVRASPLLTAPPAPTKIQPVTPQVKVATDHPRPLKNHPNQPTGSEHKGKKRKPAVGSPRNPGSLPGRQFPINVRAPPFQPASFDFPALGGAGSPSSPDLATITLLQKNPKHVTASAASHGIEPKPVDKKQPKKATLKKQAQPLIDSKAAPSAAAAVASGKARPKQTKNEPLKTPHSLSGVLQPKKDTGVMDAHHSAAVLGGFFPVTPRDTTAAAHSDSAQFDLLRLYSEGKMTVQKGRQRVRPQKKKFTSLKKKVLEERLRKWKECHPDAETSNDLASASANKSGFTTVCLYGYCEPDELEDDDEFDEMITNLHAMATKIGITKRVFIPRSRGDYDCYEEGEVGAWPVFVDFDTTNPDNTTSAPAGAAVECWNGLVLGGQELKCRPMAIGAEHSSLLEDDALWQEWCLSVMRSSEAHVEDASIKDTEQVDAETLSTLVILENALTDDDLDDDDCLEESLNDIRTLASKFGQVESIAVDKEVDPPRLLITYSGDARNAVPELNKIVIGGQHVTAKIASPLNEEKSSVVHGGFFVQLLNVLTDDDLEDEDCLTESLNDVQELAQQFGQVQGVVVDKQGKTAASGAVAHAVLIYFSTIYEAKDGARGFDGMIIGGFTVKASLGEGQDLKADATIYSDPPSNKEPETMFSGDKIIPERFAECKRVPKIVNQEATRQYATLGTDETIKPLLVEMLGELTRLQRRSMEDKNAKARRRIVMGLREVARGIRSHKVKMVVMANNLDEYGIIDKTLQDIIDLSQTEGIPVFFELNKRALGKALGKSIKVAVAGIQNADGAHQQFKKLVAYASKVD